MRKTVRTFIATSLIAATPAVFAATQGDDTKPAPTTGNMGQMMQDKGQMDHGMSMKDGNMPMMKMMTQMNEMMATCNNMMQTRMEKSSSGDGSAEKS